MLRHFPWKSSSAQCGGHRVGMVPVNLIDSLLRQIIFARGLRTPMPVIVVGVIGGTLSNGIIGLLVGPIVLAVASDFVGRFCWG